MCHITFCCIVFPHICHKNLNQVIIFLLDFVFRTLPLRRCQRKKLIDACHTRAYTGILKSRYKVAEQIIKNNISEYKHVRKNFGNSKTNIKLYSQTKTRLLYFFWSWYLGLWHFLQDNAI